MTRSLSPVIVTLYARVGDSEVLNDIGSISVAAMTTDIPEDHKRAPGATNLVHLDLASALHALADQIEKERP